MGSRWKRESGNHSHSFPPTASLSVRGRTPPGVITHLSSGIGAFPRLEISNHSPAASVASPGRTKFRDCNMIEWRGIRGRLLRTGSRPRRFPPEVPPPPPFAVPERWDPSSKVRVGRNDCFRDGHPPIRGCIRATPTEVLPCTAQPPSSIALESSWAETTGLGTTRKGELPLTEATCRAI